MMESHWLGAVTIMEYPVTWVQCAVIYHYGISNDWVQCTVSYYYGIPSDLGAVCYKLSLWNIQWLGCSVLSVIIMEYPVTGAVCSQLSLWNIQWLGCSVLSVIIMEYPVSGVQCAVSYRYGISSDWGAVCCKLSLWNIQWLGRSVLSGIIMEYPVTGAQCAVRYHYGILPHVNTLQIFSEGWSISEIQAKVWCRYQVA